MVPARDDASVFNIQGFIELAVLGVDTLNAKAAFGGLSDDNRFLKIGNAGIVVSVVAVNRIAGPIIFVLHHDMVDKARITINHHQKVFHKIYQEVEF